ncbi:probable protein S-acyltransferase 7 [Mangifera indica]|uniref:probable protein S-acyltransferase 7 n=1 Tax=Mangifera indica TaxID=29780 RepID=UPI001CFBF5A7|nr:probable protein S-acyltransferase 7 [Mangifera indica]
MAFINQQMETSENDRIVLEEIALSEPPEQVVFDSLTENNSRIYNKMAAQLGNCFVSLRQYVFAVKGFIQDLWLQYVRGENSERIRAYQVWPGNNVFFFHGRLICGPDPKGLLLTTVSITLSSWIFAMYTRDDLPIHSNLIVPISVILTTIVLVNLTLVTATDPGIIPRNDQASMEEVGTSNGARRKIVTINGVELRLKYCRICKIFRPPRSGHCVVCDNCVEKFDHHCPWIGQCIAQRNYRFYLTFVTSTLVFFIYVFAFSIWGIHQRRVKNSTGLLWMPKDCPEFLALICFSFAAICFLGGLAIYHMYLTATNQTAYENFRQRYVNSQNPYDKGILSNVKEVLFAPIPPSRVDFRAEVMSRPTRRP